MPFFRHHSKFQLEFQIIERMKPLQICTISDAVIVTTVFSFQLFHTFVPFCTRDQTHPMPFGAPLKVSLIPLCIAGK